MARIINSRSAMVFALSFVILACGKASAVNRTWTGPPGGTFQTPGNWSGGVAPGPMDTAIFSIFALPYTVNFSGSYATERLRINTSSVTFYIGAGNTYTLAYDPSSPSVSVGPSIVIGNESSFSPSAALTLASGTLSAYDLQIGSIPFGNSGSLMVQSGADLILTDTLHVADVSSGSVNVAGAGSTITAANAHFGISGQGSLIVQSGASFTASGELAVGSTFSASVGLPVDGAAGSGSVSVVGGSQVSSDSTIIGGNMTTSGAPISGTVYLANGSTWSAASEITIGYYSTGNLFEVSQGATLDAGAAVNYIGRAAGSSGELTIRGPGSTWQHGLLVAGDAGNGYVTVENGATVTGASGGLIGVAAAGVGTVIVRDAGTTWTGGPNAIGFLGEGWLSVEDGASVISPVTTIATMPGSVGTVVVRGQGSSWTVDELFVGGDMGMAGGIGTVWVDTGATLTVNGIGPAPPPGAAIADSFAIWGGGTVNLNGGTINTPRIDLTDDEDFVGGGGTFNWFTGNLNMTDPTWTLTVGADGVLGAVVPITPTRNLSVAGTTLIQTGSEIIIDGGEFESGALDIDGALTFNSGTLGITGPAGLTISAAGALGNSVALGQDQILNVTATATVAADGLLALQGGRFTAGTINNNGRIDLDGVTSLLGGALFNSGLVTGDGQIAGTLANQGSGVVRADTGSHLRFTGAGNSNAGQIALAGGTVEFENTLTNDAGGDIVGRGVLVTGALTNSGDIAFSSGITDVYGDVTNAAGGRVTVSGNSDTTFWDDVTNSGALFRVSAGSSTTFFGAYAGGGITGTGNLYFESDVTPGYSPAEVQLGGDVNFGPTASLQIELGGTVKGAEYDALTIAGAAALDGALEVTLLDLGAGLFAPKLGDTFEFLTAAGGLTGSFAELLFPALEGFVAWEPIFGADGIVLAVVPSLTGDFNGDGVVDAADYVVWRKSLGQSGAGLVADANRSGLIDQGDFDLWRANFGRRAPIDSTLSSSSHAGVPEPAGGLLLILAAVLGIWNRHRSIW